MEALISSAGIYECWCLEECTIGCSGSHLNCLLTKHLVGFFPGYTSKILYIYIYISKSVGKWDLLYTMYFTGSSLKHTYSVKIKHSRPPSDPDFKRDVGQTP